MGLLRMPDLTPFLAFLLVVSTIGPFLFGYHLAELNAPQDVLTCVRKQPGSTSDGSLLPQCIPMSTLQFSVVSSIFTLGGLLGALSIGSAAARYGRLKTMRYTTIFFTLGPIAESCAPNISTIALGRFISGIGAGASLVVVPIYVSEISPLHRRGLFGAFTQVMVNTGILVTQLLGYFLSRGQLWRIVLGVGGFIGLNQLLGLVFAVESPKWHLEHGFITQGKENLQSIRGGTYDIQRDVQTWGIRNDVHEDEAEESLLDEQSQSHIEDYGQPRQATNAFQPEQISTLTAPFNPRYTRAIISVMVVMVSQQFTGINSIVMYGVSLLSDLLQQSSALLNVCVSAVNVLITILCAPLSDRLGRKFCLISSILGMGVSAFFLAIAIKTGIKMLAAITVLTFVGSFGVGLGPIPFILASELVGPEAVGATQSWALAANWISTFVVAQFFPILNQSLGKGNVYFVFTALAAGFATFVALGVPESKGKASADEVWRRVVQEERVDR